MVGIVAALLVVAGATATVLVLNHRSDVAAQERRAEAAAKAKAEADAEAKQKAAEEREAEEKAAALAQARETYAACTNQLGKLTTALSNIDARLDVGLSQSELSDFLGKASIAYNQIDVQSLGDGNCLRAGGKLESAFNSYNATVSTWSDCIFDYSCDVDADVLPGMQLKWAKASGLIDQAQRLLKTLDPDSPTYDVGAAGSQI